jgi:hypothetical protein
MFEITIGLALFLVVIAVPRLRRAVLSLLGLFAIIAVGSAVFSGVIWGLYESKPWLTADVPSLVQEEPATEDADKGSIATAEEDLESALAGEEAQRLEDEQQRLEEERLRIEIMVARARVILEEDRKLAAQAASFPLPDGVGETLGDIMAIRIPAWRDKAVAEAQKESIRSWLKSIGLTAEETASIVTAKAWGALYDIWVAENPDVALPSPQVSDTQVASTPSEPESLPDQESPSPQSEPAPAPPPFVGQILPRREVIRRPSPSRFAVPRRAAPLRRSPGKREVGPFGY